MALADETNWIEEKQWTYEDYCALPDDGKRYEVIGGRLYVSPSPSSIHQILSRRLQFLFYELERAGDGFIFNAPMDLRLVTADAVQPDLIYLSASQKPQIRRKFLEGPPALIIEIQSPSTAALDRVRKLQAYAGAGVPHYWLLDPEAITLEILKLDGETYRIARVLGPKDVWACTDPAAVRIDMEDLFRDLPVDED